MGATYFSAIQRGTLSVNPGAIADQSRGSIAVTLTGLAVGDLLQLEPPAALEAGLAYSGFLISANTVTIYLYNSSGGSIDGAALNWIYSWFDCTP